MINKAAISLLEKLVSTPSLSGLEDQTAAIIGSFLEFNHIDYDRYGNNIVATNKHFQKGKKTIVLNSHHDTVKPNNSYTYPPYEASHVDDRLIGLGVNDAGASLVALIFCFMHFYENKSLPFNLVLIASAEEENSGDNGIRSVFPKLEFDIDLAIIGEPTGCQLAIAEKGLLVIDGIAKGEAGHAARPNGKNAIDIAIDDIHRINQFQFDQVSELLGPTIATVTQINAGKQHNVIPDLCSFVIDARVNEHYQLPEVLSTLQNICKSTLTQRSFKNRSSGISNSHPIVEKARKLGLTTFGSPTLSDQAHFNCPSVKIGPGLSERSHTADEYIYVNELQEGIDTYIALLSDLKI